MGVAKKTKEPEKPDPWLVPMGERLGKVRAAIFKQETKAARAFGISPSRWGNYESGLRPIPLELLVWLSENHHCPSDYILRDQPNVAMGDDLALKIFGARIIELPPRSGRAKN